MIRPGLVPSRFAPLLTSLAAIGAALILGGVFLAMRGKDPIAAYGMLLSRGLGTSYGITETLIRMAPLLIVYIFSQRWVISGVTRGSIK